VRVSFRRLRGLAPVLTAGVLAAGCAGSDDSALSAPAGGAVPSGAAEQQAPGAVKLALVRGGLDGALLVTHAPGQAGRLYVALQSGRVVVLQGRRVLPRPFLDVSSRISSGGERGLLGLAFHPGYARNGRFFVNYTDTRGDTRVVEYRRGADGRARPGSARVLLTIDQPAANHNGGHLAFGPDGHLYIATGDGGGAGDPEGAGQRLDTLLGKLLRIDVDRRPGGRPYAIPRGNPFRAAGQRREIYAYGLRNPWRFSFDRDTGDLWIGDVGQSEREEINFRPAQRAAGTNFGWNAFEGRVRYPGGGPVRGRAATPPVAEYTHASGDGCSVTGGYVYRGRAVPVLRGRYLYADFCTGKVWSMRAGPRPRDVREITGSLGRSLSGVTSFGEGPTGELYVIGSGSLYRFVHG
jgi:glucose/arabinose dehydrogenase